MLLDTKKATISVLDIFLLIFVIHFNVFATRFKFHGSTFTKLFIFSAEVVIKHPVNAIVTAIPLDKQDASDGKTTYSIQVKLLW